MAFCLPKFAAQEFKTKLKSGDINPAMLADMTSKERNQFFSGFLTKEQAAATNALFESKTLLKNQQQGMITWAKTVSGLKEPARKELIDKINKLDKVLTPEEQDRFLADLAAQRLGVGVTADEAAKIAELAQKVNETKGAGDRMDYGRAKVALNNYVADLKLEAGKKTLKEMAESPLTSARDIAGQAKGIVASLDNSAIFNQGWKPMWTNPKIWAKNATETFTDIAKVMGGKNVLDEVMADIVSRPNYDLMKKAKLAVGLSEEVFPPTIAEKIPGIARLYKASETAYTGFLQKTRADIFDKMVDIAEKTGVDLDKNELESIGRMVNSLTGRGDFGNLEGSAVKVADTLLFSPRFLKSQFDVLAQPITGAGGSSFVRKQAAQNLLKMVGGTAVILGIVKSLDPDAVELDPRSSDFGSIKVGNTRFKLGGGLPAVVTLASRLGTLSTKSSTTGKVKELNAGGFGDKTAFDLIIDFFANKASPAAGAVRDLLKGKDFDGNEVALDKSETYPTIAYNIGVPFPIRTYEELAKDPDSANDLLAMIASGLGINVSNYGPR